VTHLPLRQDRELAAALAVDAILGGHDHDPTIHEEGRTVIVKAGSDALNVGQVEYEVRCGAVIARRQRLIPVDERLAEAADIVALVRQQTALLARELDADNAAQQIAVQYRIGASGEFINLPSGYIPDASNGSALVTSRTVSLPSTVNNEAQVQIRIITTNATGSDSLIGIDNISVTSDQAPQTVRFASDSLVVAQSEGDAGSTAFTFTVERIGTTDGDVDFTVELNSTAADSADFAGSPALPLVINGTILATEANATVTVNVNGDTDIEANENFTVTITQVSNASAPVAIDANQDEAIGRILADEGVARAAAEFVSGRSQVASPARPSLPSPAPLY